MPSTHNVLFGLGLETGVHQMSEMLGHARLADDAGLDLVSLSDHPYFAERIDAYAALGFVLGATDNLTAAVIMTNLLSRPAPILARTVTGLSTVSGGRFVLGMGAGGLEEEILALGVPRLSPAARVRALEEAIMDTEALSRRRRTGHVQRRVLPSHRAGTLGRADTTDLDRRARPEDAGRNGPKRRRVDTRAPGGLAQPTRGRVSPRHRRGGGAGREKPG